MINEPITAEKAIEIDEVRGAALLEFVERRALEGTPATIDQALEIAHSCEPASICEAADRVRSRWNGSRMDTCSIINARSGRCSEDCKWCAQSRHFATGITEYEAVGADEALAEASENERRGVHRFSLVTSGRRVAPAQMEQFLEMFRNIRRNCKIELCASMGLLSVEQMRQLKEVGVSRYHCNLETSSSFFPTLCTTHTHADKLRTIKAAQEAGLEVCSGGIIGMGESLRQRLELAAEARDAGAVSMPVNILHPIPGTALAETPLISEDEVILSVALMRLVAPKLSIRFAGGRARISRSGVERMLKGGVSGSIVGDMLTTLGYKMEDDFALFEKLNRL
ncbi:MAG: biotin synthase BioB [Bacteroides sp.]|nr:biotin synthase BioB [Bacteroides sp.]